MTAVNAVTAVLAAWRVALGTVKAPLHALVVGDVIFDTFGREHRIIDITVAGTQSAPTLWIERDDRRNQWQPIGFLDWDTITIRPTLVGRGWRLATEAEADRILYSWINDHYALDAEGALLVREDS